MQKQSFWIQQRETGSINSLHNLVSAVAPSSRGQCLRCQVYWPWPHSAWRAARHVPTGPGGGQRQDRLGMPSCSGPHVKPSIETTRTPTTICISDSSLQLWEKIRRYKLVSLIIKKRLFHLCHILKLIND